MQRLRFVRVCSFSYLLIISFFVHLFVLFSSSTFLNFSKILNKNPNIYRFVSVNWLENDDIKSFKKDKKILSNIDRNEKGFFIKDKKIEVEKFSRKSKKEIIQTTSLIPLGINRKKRVQLGTIKKEGTLEKSRMDFRKKSSIGNIKSERSRKVIMPIEKYQKKNSNLISKKESVSIDGTIPKRETDSRKVSRELFDRRAGKPFEKRDPLKLFRIATKEKKSFEVSENVLNKVASADFDSEKKMKDDEPISLSTRKAEFFRYFKHIKAKIEESWAWWAPEAKGLHGKLKLRFTLLRNGSLKKLVLLESSGHGVLDDEAMSAVTRASVFFRPLPLKMKRKSLNIDGTFEYVSERFFVRKFLRN